ncbi:MAG: hypothetical protein ACR2PL_14520, partial [Dehalococcoidia bacterium]
MKAAFRRCWPLIAVSLLLLTGVARQTSAQGGHHTEALALAQGWNLVADPGGLVTNTPAYTLQLNDVAYEILMPGTTLAPGLGYWVYSREHGALPLPGGTNRAGVQAPAGRFVMIGDPSGVVEARVTGADILLGYNPASGYYPLSTTTLAPGQGAFALSFAGGRIMLDTLSPSTASCSTADLGSACPINGSCPTNYPVTVTQDSVVHPAAEPGIPSPQGIIVLCFNDVTQATSAGYHLEDPFRFAITGPASGIVDNIRISVLRATLETPQAFVARAQAAGEQLCAVCSCCSGATAIVTVDYQLDNIDRPPTLFNPSSQSTFRAGPQPGETEPGLLILSSQHFADVVHSGSATEGTAATEFVQTRFNDIQKVDWQLHQPLLDAVTPGQHGPNISFELDFRGPRAGQIVVSGGGVTPNLPSFDPTTVGAPVFTASTCVALTGNGCQAGAGGGALIAPAPPQQPTAIPAATASPSPTQQATPTSTGTPNSNGNGSGASATPAGSIASPTVLPILNTPGPSTSPTAA